jgi:hypothetical protein
MRFRGSDGPFRREGCVYSGLWAGCTLIRFWNTEKKWAAWFSWPCTSVTSTSLECRLLSVCTSGEAILRFGYLLSSLSEANGAPRVRLSAWVAVKHRRSARSAQKRLAGGYPLFFSCSFPPFAASDATSIDSSVCSHTAASRVHMRDLGHIDEDFHVETK